MNRYLAAQGDRVPVHSVEEIVKSRRFHPSVQSRLESAQLGEGPEQRGLPGGARVPGRGPRGRRQDDGRAEARCVRLPDVEQPAAADRRPEHAARRQQPVLLADDRVSGHQRADGIHARRDAAGRPHAASVARGASRRCSSSRTPTSRRRVTGARRPRRLRCAESEVSGQSISVMIWCPETSRPRGRASPAARAASRRRTSPASSPRRHPASAAAGSWT